MDTLIIPILRIAVHTSQRENLMEEEPGCELFATNSFKHFPECCLLDSYDEPLYFETIDEAAKYLVLT